MTWTRLDPNVNALSDAYEPDEETDDDVVKVLLLPVDLPHVLALIPVVKVGDLPGHEFHGNQYTGGKGGSDDHKTSDAAQPPKGKGPTNTTNDHVDAKGVLHTDNIYSAAKALASGQSVMLAQPRQVSTLLDELARIAADAKAKGVDAPTYDIGKVSVEGTNLFAIDSMGYARIDMPQLSGKPSPGSIAAGRPIREDGTVDMTQDFVSMLTHQGVKVTAETEEASYLRATQRELDGAKVGGVMGFMATPAGAKLRDRSIVVSRDNYILDGHHSWAAKVGLDAADNVLGQERMNVQRVDLDIMSLLHISKDWASKVGLPQAGL